MTCCDKFAKNNDSLSPGNIYTNRLTQSHHSMPNASFADIESTCFISKHNWDHALSALLVLVVSHMNGRVSHKVSISKKPFVLIEDMFI